MSYLVQQLIPWQKKFGRHNLPWQNSQNPYAIWLSEIMLQQTQVNTVIPYYQRFMQRFPDLKHLANAPVDDVLAYWSGLGYYSRARNLHQAACLIMKNHQGVFPQNRPDLEQLPGIGRSTAAAIRVFAFNQRDAILDGNVKRVFSRFFAIEGYPGKPATLKKLWQLAEAVLPEKDIQHTIKPYTQGLMDLGSAVCMRSKPHCESCPLQKRCMAYKQNRVVQLPEPRPKKLLPVKETAFMIYRSNGKLLLKKRPDTGVWGGLWCFPEEEQDSNLPFFLMKKEIQLVELPQLLHTFTHFKLLIRPYIQEVRAKNVGALPVVWTTPDGALELALPAPVRQLIHQHFLS